MSKFNVNLRKFIPKLSIKHLLFVILIIIGCSYQIIQVTQVFLKFETKIDVKYDENNENAIPMVSFCKPTKFMFRNSSQVKQFSLAQLYNQTYSFGEMFVGIEYIKSNGKFGQILNFTDQQQNNSEIYYEKTIDKFKVCYHFKFMHSKQLRHKQGTIYKFQLYQQNGGTSIINFPYALFITSDVNYPDVQKDNFILVYGNHFFL